MAKYSDENLDDDGVEAKNYDNHDWCLAQLKVAQEADHDNREQAREAAIFISKRNGQWEQQWWDASDGKPRYTFDLTTPVVDQIIGAIERSDFSIQVSPSGGEATQEIAETFDDLIRNIQNISKADMVYSQASRAMITRGLDGWRVVSKYVDGDSFDQDLVIEKIPDFINSCWIGHHTMPDASDAKMCWILTGMTKADYRAKFPDGTGDSVSTDETTQSYYYREDLIMVGEFIYIKEVPRTLILMDNGMVLEDDDDFAKLKDELAASGVTEKRRRTRNEYVVCSRLFDTDDWLSGSRETVFRNWLPVVPVYANFDYYEDKILYRGVVEKLIDPQRVYNYSKSREVEEAALAPRAKYWMTAKQVGPYKQQLSTLNTNADPIQLYVNDEQVPGPPVQVGGAQINPGVASVSQSMQDIIGLSSGMFAANMGDNPNLQSGVAIEALQDRGDVGSNKYIAAREVAQAQTGRILVDAIPRVYEPGRQVRLLGEDGTQSMRTIGIQIIDQQTGEVEELNDLSIGKYDVVCTSGPAFKSRQSETVKALTEIGAIKPDILDLSGDILLRNINSPGMGDVADRERARLFAAGMIPQDQMTEEELAQLQQSQQNQEQVQDPNMVLAMAEQAKAESDLMNSQTKAQESVADIQIRTQELQIKAYEAETDRKKVDIQWVEVQGKLPTYDAKAMKDMNDALRPN